MGTDTRSPWSKAFTVEGTDDGFITLVQVDAKEFELRGRIRFDGKTGLPPEIEQKLGDDLRTIDGMTLGRTDLASVPRFMRWFEGSYGRHTPAALIHDDLIVDTPNAGLLGSDTLSDRYFRFMLEASGVPFFKRWIMWAAVALRTRWAVGGLRRASLLAWVLLATFGYTIFIWSVVGLLIGWQWWFGLTCWWTLSGALALAVASGALWGRQFGASLVSALAVPWILPAGLLAAAGYGVYLALEWVACRVEGLATRRRRPPVVAATPGARGEARSSSPAMTSGGWRAGPAGPRRRRRWGGCRPIPEPPLGGPG